MRNAPENHARLRRLAFEIVERLQSSGKEAFWVGGCVRDELLHRAPLDYDIATSALPEEIEALFPKTFAVGRQFGVMLVLRDNHPFQVATFRTETGYHDGRRPSEVAFSTPQTDATRRDFTVNGLFYDPVRNLLHDWVGGRQDIELRLIRTIGSPEERFAEDHLRPLRAVRLAAQLNFQIEPRTLQAVRHSSHLVATVSAERIRDELIKLFSPPHAADGLLQLRESSLLEVILPELAATVHCRQSPEFHPEGSVFNHLLLMLKQLPSNPDPSLPWAVLLHDIAKPLTASTDPHDGQIHFYGHEKTGAHIAEEILRRLRFPRRQIETIVFAVRHHMQFKDVQQMRQATLNRLLMRPTFPLELQLHRLDCLGSHGRLDNYHFLLEAKRRLNTKPALHPPLLSGDDLIALGMKPGPALGQMLHRIREKQLQEELHTREQALQWAQEILNSPR